MGKRMSFTGYLVALLKGFLITCILLAFGLQRVKGQWQVPVTPYAVWIFLSWLVCYPELRRHFASLFIKNSEEMTSYKTRSLAMHQQDMQNSHRDRRWTTNGVTVNPWAFTTDTTQSTDEILNPIYVYCERLWATLLLILFGPIISLFLVARWVWRKVA